MEPTLEAGLESAGGMKTVPGPVVQIDEGRIQVHLDEVVRARVEETLHGLLDAEAGCAGSASTSARRAARTHGQAATIGACRPRPAK
jgi:hypothetical protein